MNKNPRLIFAFGILMVSILACKLPGSQSSSQPNLAATITAQAMLLETPTATLASQTQTPAATGPEVSVSATTNCRTGPGSDYDVVFTMNPGSTAQVVGKDTPDDYWIIDDPAGGTCWLWGQYATVNGDTSGLPDYPTPAMSESQTNTPKPTKTPKPTATFTPFPPPAVPTNLSGSRTGAKGLSGLIPIWKETYTLTWTDNATNETYYRIGQNNLWVAILGPNSTRYSNSFQYPQDHVGQSSDTFFVEAGNSAGGNWASITISRCP